MANIPTLEPEEIRFIELNYESMRPVDIAKTLKRGTNTIYDYLKLRGWTPFKAEQKPRGKSHPFRQKNRALENYFVARKLQQA